MVLYIHIGINNCTPIEEIFLLCNKSLSYNSNNHEVQYLSGNVTNCCRHRIIYDAFNCAYYSNVQRIMLSMHYMITPKLLHSEEKQMYNINYYITWSSISGDHNTTCRGGELYDSADDGFCQLAEFIDIIIF